MSGQMLDVSRWRRAERERLIAARLKLDPDYRAAQTLAIGGELDRLIPCIPGTIVSVYWPIRAEPDLRPWMHSTCEKGIRKRVSRSFQPWSSLPWWDSIRPVTDSATEGVSSIARSRG